MMEPSLSSPFCLWNHTSHAHALCPVLIRDGLVCRGISPVDQLSPIYLSEIFDIGTVRRFERRAFVAPIE
jgi:hypothetical protein